MTETTNETPPDDLNAARARVRQTLTRPSNRPAHYRLSTETWMIILDAYRNGATVPELAAQWRVSEPALRKRITRHGATKRDWGDEQAVKQALEAGERIEQAARERQAADAALGEALFAPRREDPGDDAFEAGDVGALALAAALASGRAMRRRMWDEARVLAGLAEAYMRLAEKGMRREGDLADSAALQWGLDYVLAILGQAEERVTLLEGLMTQQGMRLPERPTSPPPP